VTSLPPPAGSFASDNAAGVSPEVMAALVEANEGPALAYGEDRWTAAMVDELRALFDAPVEVLLAWGGTGANVVGLATVLQPWQSVVSTDTAHIVVDECGAPARFTGSTITPVPHVDGKLTIAAVEPFLHWLGTEHHPQPAVLSISQVSEMGTVYRVDEIGELCDFAHANDMAARLAARVAGIPGVVVTRPPEANSVFVQLPADRIRPLQEWSFFWEWDLTQSMVRWMTSFATTDDDIDRFAAGVGAILSS
jgi:threonine aldolase